MRMWWKDRLAFILELVQENRTSILTKHVYKNGSFVAFTRSGGCMQASVPVSEAHLLFCRAIER